MSREPKYIPEDRWPGPRATVGGIFTELSDGRALTIVSVNDGGLEMNCQLTPREAFKAAGQLFWSAIKTGTVSGSRRVREAVKRPTP
jgi:hypothetical protein